MDVDQERKGFWDLGPCPNPPTLYYLALKWENESGRKWSRGVIPVKDWRSKPKHLYLSSLMFLFPAVPARSIFHPLYPHPMSLLLNEGILLRLPPFPPSFPIPSYVLMMRLRQCVIIIIIIISVFSMNIFGKPIPFPIFSYLFQKLRHGPFSIISLFLGKTVTPFLQS